MLDPSPPLSLSLSISIPCVHYVTAAITYIVKATPQCACVFYLHPPNGFPVQACEQFSEDLMWASPLQRSPVGVSR